MHTLTPQSSFQSYDPPSTAAISSDRPPPNGAVPGTLGQHQPRPLAYPTRKGMDSEIASSIVPTARNRMDSETASSRVPTARNRMDSEPVSSRVATARTRMDSEATSSIVPTTSMPQIPSSHDIPMPSDATNGRSRSRVVLHQDSGIRLRRDSEEEEEDVEMPPLYTPG